MKKFMRNCAILACVFIVLGLGLALTAAVFKGPSALSGLIHDIPWGEWGDGIVSGLEGLDSGIRYEIEENIAFDKAISIIKGDTDQTFSADEIEDLDVEVGACEFVLEESEDGDFHVKVENAGGYQGYVRDDTLHIKGLCETTVGTQGGCSIWLYIPKEFVFEDVNISLGAGMMSGSQALQTDSLSIELGAGEITLTSLVANTLDAEVGMGSLEVSGDIREAADVECGMGSVQMELAGEESDFNYQLQTAAGDVSIGNRSYGGLAGEQDIDNHAGKDISVECAMGSIGISFE